MATLRALRLLRREWGSQRLTSALSVAVPISKPGVKPVTANPAFIDVAASSVSLTCTPLIRIR